MEIQPFFLNGDMKGAIAYMRAHEEFRDILPAYAAIFENQEYRTYEIPDALNTILRLYQVYFRDVFYAACRRRRPRNGCGRGCKSFWLCRRRTRRL